MGTWTQTPIAPFVRTGVQRSSATFSLSFEQLVVSATPRVLLIIVLRSVHSLYWTRTPTRIARFIYLHTHSYNSRCVSVYTREKGDSYAEQIAFEISRSRARTQPALLYYVDVMWFATADAVRHDERED